MGNRSIGLFYLSILFLVLLTASSSRAYGARIIVCLRYDDYSSRSNTQLEVELIKALKESGVYCTFGVIPFVSSANVHDPSPQDLIPLTMRKAAILRRAAMDGVIEVALHGYSHQTIRVVGDHGYTEFLGLALSQQVQKLEKGKIFLEEATGRPIFTFIPPWNSYDLSTLQALERLNFHAISAGLYGPVLSDGKLRYLPATCGLTDLKEAIRKSGKIGHKSALIVALLHPYDFTESGNTRAKLSLARFRHLMHWLTSQSDVEVMTIRQACEQSVDLGYSRFLANRFQAKLLGFTFNIRSLLPAFLKRLVPNYDGVYLEESGAATRIQHMYILYTLLFYAALSTLSWLICLSLLRPFLRNQGRFMLTIVKVGVPLLLVICLARALSDFTLSTMPGAVAIAVLFGMSVGVWYPGLRRSVRPAK